MYLIYRYLLVHAAAAFSVSRDSSAERKVGTRGNLGTPCIINDESGNYGEFWWKKLTGIFDFDFV